jgi:RimJ/RimL family protein N-acetyltransferase
VRRAARGRGVATSALRMLSRWALTSAGFERLQLVTETQNVASQRVAVKAGFQREGLLRSFVKVDGDRVDGVMFGLLRDDVTP